MHPSSFYSMQYLAKQISAQRGRAHVLDVGAMIAEPNQRCYRPIIQDLGMKYTGLDIAAGLNVDVVAEQPYKFPLTDETYDVVISGQAFEHIDFPWLTIKEIARVMKPGGIAVIIAPSSGPEHRYPQDCWRYYPDGMKALARWAGLECLHAGTNWPSTKKFDWGDTVGIFWKKTDASPPTFDTAAIHPPEIDWSFQARVRRKVTRTVNQVAGLF